MTSAPYNLRESSNRVPSGPNALARSVVGCLEYLTPFRKCERLVVDADYDVVAPVSLLLLVRGPAAVAWFVIAIIVNSLNLKAALVRWRHILNKIVGIVPSLTNRDASAPVTGESLVLGVIASSHHPRPNAEKRLAPLPMGGRALFLKAPATLRVAGDQLIKSGGYVRGTAIAPTNGGVAVCARRLANSEHGEALKLLTDIACGFLGVVGNQSKSFQHFNLPVSPKVAAQS